MQKRAQDLNDSFPSIFNQNQSKPTLMQPSQSAKPDSMESSRQNQHTTGKSATNSCRSDRDLLQGIVYPFSMRDQNIMAPETSKKEELGDLDISGIQLNESQTWGGNSKLINSELSQLKPSVKHITTTNGMTHHYTVESSKPAGNMIDELLCTPQIMRETAAKASNVGGIKNYYSSNYQSVDRSAKVP